MKNIAAVVPIHPPKYEFARNLLNSYRPEFLDLYFVFTNEHEKELFGNLGDAKSIVLDSSLPHQELSQLYRYVTFKKFYGISKIYDEYDYILTLDSECMFINQEKLQSVVENFCNKKEVYGCPQQNISEISLKCIEYLKIFDRQKFMDVVPDVYFWFSQIPIYESSIVKRFLKFINFQEYEFQSKILSWYTFDYIIYIYYCVQFEGYKIINLNDFGIFLNHSLEERLTNQVEDVMEKNGIEINWQACKLMRNVKKNKVLIYHIDNIEKS
jgi:hypothetical protein